MNLAEIRKSCPFLLERDQQTIRGKTREIITNGRDKSIIEMKSEDPSKNLSAATEFKEKSCTVEKHMISNKKETLVYIYEHYIKNFKNFEC